MEEKKSERKHNDDDEIEAVEGVRNYNVRFVFLFATCHLVCLCISAFCILFSCAQGVLVPHPVFRRPQLVNPMKTAGYGSRGELHAARMCGIIGGPNILTHVEGQYKADELKTGDWQGEGKKRDQKCGFDLPRGQGYGNALLCRAVRDGTVFHMYEGRRAPGGGHNLYHYRNSVRFIDFEYGPEDRANASSRKVFRFHFIKGEVPERCLLLVLLVLSSVVCLHTYSAAEFDDVFGLFVHCYFVCMAQSKREQAQVEIAAAVAVAVASAHAAQMKTVRCACKLYFAAFLTAGVLSQCDNREERQAPEDRALSSCYRTFTFPAPVREQRAASSEQ